MPPAKARTRTTRSGDERTNHEATAPPTEHCFNISRDILYLVFYHFSCKTYDVITFLVDILVKRHFPNFEKLFNTQQSFFMLYTL